MSFKDLEIKKSYISQGKDNFADSFLIPALRFTKEYKRSVGFFSSDVFSIIMSGIVSLARNGGMIKLICSPRLSEDDIEAIQAGYDSRKQISTNAFSRSFLSEIEKMSDLGLKMLYDLISHGTMDIRIAITNNAGMYHDKLGILKDSDGNRVAFFGSSNSSYNGYRVNYEKVRVVRDWDVGSLETVNDEEAEFDSLWNNTNPHVEVYDYEKTATEHLLVEIKKREAQQSTTGITLRDYQEEAITAWIKNEYRGFFVMATGTGKTWTAIFAAQRLLKSHPAMVVISAPYKHLVRQWADDVVKMFPTAKIILVSSENPNWENEIKQEIIRKKYHPDTQIIIISTLASFRMERFLNAVFKSKEEKLLIVDEAHRFSDRPDIVKNGFHYFLGLSATPYSGTSSAKGQELMDWFGGQVYSLPIENALEKGFLVPYYYYPIFVTASAEEEKRFKNQTQKILSCFNKNGICINPDLLVKSIRNRLRIISMAEEKHEKIDWILETVQERDHVVVYCGDGHLFDEDKGEEIRHIQSIKKVLSEHGFKASQFTATENMATRMELVDAFNKGEIAALAAIRCLDEGINIPSIKSALILSSNDDYREFVQRRGRILRRYPMKAFANIYDVIVLPSTDLQNWAKIELRRFLEYGRLSLNWSDLKERLISLLEGYGLRMEDVDVYDYDDVEVNLDE